MTRIEINVATGEIKQIELPTEEIAEAEARTAEEMQKTRIPAIKARAREVILARYPEWKQANMTAHAVQLTRKLVAGTATTEELAMLDRYETEIWGWIQDVRRTSDAAEASGITAEQITWP